MNQHNNYNFNTEPILNEIDLTIKRGLNKILEEFMDRYKLLENTHKQIMLLPSVLSELNNMNDSDIDDSEIDDKPIFVSISEMTQNLVRDEINCVEKKITQLEDKYNSLIPFLDKLITKIDSLNEKLNKTENAELKHINTECAVYDKNINFKENIKLEIVEQYNEDQDEEPTDDQEDELEEEEKEEQVETENEQEEDEDQVETEEDQVETEDEDQVETEEESEEEEDQEDQKHVKEENIVQEEEEELFEIEIDDITYCTNNEENGYIYELTEDGECGEKVGYLKEGEPFFFADEK